LHASCPPHIPEGNSVFLSFTHLKAEFCNQHGYYLLYSC
jgi:hypothetical protein